VEVVYGMFTDVGAILIDNQPALPVAFAVQSLLDTLTDGNTTTDILYQNTYAYSAGAGYYVTDQLYLSGSYNISNSIYTTTEDIENVSIYTYYAFNEHWFGTFSYAKGLSNSANKNYTSLRLGYFF